MKLEQIILFLPTCLGIIFTASLAIAQSGIYLERKNFEKGITDYQIPCVTKLSSSDQYNFYRKNYLNLSPNENIKKFKKKDLWGYRDCRNINYKVINNLHYQILENDAMVIYKLAFTTKASYLDFTIGIIPEFFFSKELDSEIMPLTEENLNEIYKGNSKYLQALQKYLNSTYSCLHCYDTYTKTYIINKLLKQSN